MTSPVAIKIEIAEGIRQKLAEQGSLSVSNITALYSITTGFKEETIKGIIETLTKAGFISVRGDKIIPFEV